MAEAPGAEFSKFFLDKFRSNVFSFLTESARRPFLFVSSNYSSRVAECLVEFLDTKEVFESDHSFSIGEVEIFRISDVKSEIDGGL